jgi:hypothetical protein
VREPRFWPIPVTSGAVVLASVALMVWVLTRPLPPTTVTVTTDTPTAEATASGQGMSILARERLECDRQVAILMSTKDLVELDRAQFLIKWFNCAVGRRLPPP